MKGDADPKGGPLSDGLETALGQIEAMIGSVKELEVWDPDGWNKLQSACVELQGAVEARLEEGRSAATAAAERARLDVAAALNRVRLQLDRLSLPEAAWEGWWATASRIKSLEARLLRRSGRRRDDDSAVA
jgi:hypothetical protein